MLRRLLNGRGKTCGHSWITLPESLPTAVTMASKTKNATPGKRTGVKKSDFRWTAPDGQIWASRFEYEVYLWLSSHGSNVRKASVEADQVSYTSDIRSGKCLACGTSGRVVKERRYTPDLVETSSSGKGTEVLHYWEVKGYLRQNERSLLREVVSQQALPNLRLLVQQDGRVGAGTVTSWANRYLKIPVYKWGKFGPELIKDERVSKVRRAPKQPRLRADSAKLETVRNSKGARSGLHASKRAKRKAKA